MSCKYLKFVNKMGILRVTLIENSLVIESLLSYVSRLIFNGVPC